MTDVEAVVVVLLDPSHHDDGFDSIIALAISVIGPPERLVSDSACLEPLKGLQANSLDLKQSGVEVDGHISEVEVLVLELAAEDGLWVVDVEVKLTGLDVDRSMERLIVNWNKVTFVKGQGEELPVRISLSSSDVFLNVLLADEESSVVSSDLVNLAIEPLVQLESLRTEDGFVRAGVVEITLGKVRLDVEAFGPGDLLSGIVTR